MTKKLMIFSGIAAGLAAAGAGAFYLAVQGFYEDTWPTWAMDGTIYFYSYRVGDGDQADIYKINPDGSGEARVTFTDHREWFPNVSRDGRKIVFVSDKGFDEPYSGGEIYVLDLVSGAQSKLTDDKSFPLARWSPDGARIIFSSRRGNPDAGDIWTMNPDGSDLMNLTNTPDISEGWPAYSADGANIVYISTQDDITDIYVMDKNGGNSRRVAELPGYESQPEFSPTGSTIAFTAPSSEDLENSEIYSIQMDGSNLARLTTSPRSDHAPTWSPDGRQIAFSTGRHGDTEIYVMGADGSNQTRLTFTSNNLRNKLRLAVGF